jgi:hypothetical protein
VVQDGLLVARALSRIDLEAALREIERACRGLLDLLQVLRDGRADPLVAAVVLEALMSLGVLEEGGH